MKAEREPGGAGGAQPGIEGGVSHCHAKDAARQSMYQVVTIDWRSTLISIGIDSNHLTGRHGPCPGCGGRDRFRFDDQDSRGTFICSQGSGELLAGDGFDLLRHVFGWNYAESCRHLGLERDPPREARPKPPPERPKPAPAPSTTQPYAIDLWARVDRSDAVVASHPYAVQKGIGWHAGAGRATVSGLVVGKDADCLVIPVREIATGNVQAVQCIDVEGRKQTFGPLLGGAFICGNDMGASQWFIVEGWADAVLMLRGLRDVCVFAAMGSGKRFDGVAEAVIKRYAPTELVIVGDAI